MKIFVLDGNLRSTLAVVRSLGKSGIAIGVGDARGSTIAGRSRYCCESLVYPSPVEQTGAFERFLRDELAPRGYTHLLAMSDVTALICGPLKPVLSPGIVVMVADAISKVQDKSAMVELAEKIGIDVPRYITGASDAELAAFAERVGYPIVIKPRRSRQCINGRWKQGTVHYANSADELIRVYGECHREIANPLVQERIEGPGIGVFLLMWNGEVKAAFSHRRIREKPPWGGVSVLCESVSADEGLVRRSAALLRDAGMNGPAMVEYKVDSRDGRPRMMEVNGRFWGSLQLAIDAGVDFPWIYCQLVRGREVSPVLHYRLGVQSRWLLGDLDSLITRVGAGAAQERLLGAGSSRSRNCLEFLRFFGHSLHYDVLSSSDQRPFLEEAWQYVKTNLTLLAMKAQTSNVKGSGN